MGVPLYRWMVDFMENPNQKWKMTGGSPMFHQFSPKIIHHFPSSFLSKLMIAWKPSFSQKKKASKTGGSYPTFSEQVVLTGKRQITATAKAVISITSNEGCIKIYPTLHP
jgi:hypothetical protein